MDSVVLHQFGDHVKCGEWCNMKKTPTAKHKNRPWGMKKLKTDLLAMFRDIDPSKLSRLGSSNCSESFNNTLRSKVPKDKHYSESGSLAYIYCSCLPKEWRLWLCNKGIKTLHWAFFFFFWQKSIIYVIMNLFLLSCFNNWVLSW